MLIDVTGIPKSCPFHIHIKLSMTAQQALIVFMSVDISGHDSAIEKTKHRIEIYKHAITTDYQINNKLVSNCAKILNKVVLPRRKIHESGDFKRL